MAESNQKEISEKMEEINLNDQASPTESDWSVEEKYMIDCINMLDDNETDIEKISKVSHQFLLATATKNAKKVLEECEADEKVSFDEETRKKKKMVFLTNIFYEESLKLLREHLLKD